MENATKALLIAAAVIVVILIISLGIGIFTMASEQVDNAANLSEYEIQKFNEKFTKYVGEDESAAEVNALVKEAFNHNCIQENASTRVRVGLDGGGNMADGKIPGENGGVWLIMREQFYEDMQVNKVPAGNRYTVKVKYDSKTKLIYQIDITTKK